MSEPTPLRRAAQYVRMSTEMQKYSITFQKALIASYAEEHGYIVVKTYEDLGVSGLTLEKRAGLRALIADALGGQADFEIILVYDVSRWGRFQNPDQAAHYEFLCAEAGLHVEYCAETFDNDGTPTSALLKHIKRAMAAEYSRELSQKVARAARIRVAQGFWSGGEAPFGYRRVIAGSDPLDIPQVDASIWRKKNGVHSTIIPGPRPEVAAVQKAFRLYLSGMSYLAVGRYLESKGWRNAKGGPWSPARVGYLLQNEIYIGRMISGRRSRPIGCDSGPLTPRSDWLVTENAVQPLVSKRLFKDVQNERAARSRLPTTEEVISDLQRMMSEHGAISYDLLNRHGRWSSGFYTRRLGKIDEMRAVLGAVPTPLQVRRREYIGRANDGRYASGKIYSDDELLELLRSVLANRGMLNNQVIEETPGVPSTTTYRSRFGSMAEVYRLLGYRPSRRQVACIKAARYCHEARRKAGWGGSSGALPTS